jgi:glycosyltransferase involved in cell wall biosynthesis
VKILLNGNAPWCPSGYAEQIALLTPRLQAMGHEVAIAANYGLQGTIAPWNGVTVYPSHGTTDSRSVTFYAEHFEADIVIALMDAWPLKPALWPDDFRMALWAPVDHYPIPPAVLAVLNDAKVQPIAMSQFGRDWMERLQLEPLYAPHAVDTEMFRPQPEMRDVVRDQMGIPRDAFLVGMVAANKGWNPQVSRKAYPQVFEAFSRFAMRHDDAWLYAHTDATPRGDGLDLETLVLAMSGLSAKPGRLVERIRFPSEREMVMGLPRELLALQYVAFDVLVNPSMGEGFGVPLIEAQACGVPVIASDHSAMTELTHAGWLVEGDPWWDALQTSYAFMPHIGSIEAGLESAYDTRGDQELRDAAVAFAAQYDIDEVADTYWQPVIDSLAKPREVAPLNGNRAQRRAAKRAKVKA